MFAEDRLMDTSLEVAQGLLFLKMAKVSSGCSWLYTNHSQIFSLRILLLRKLELLVNPDCLC